MPWLEKPKSLTEKGYRRLMARTKTVKIHDVEYKLQSVSPSWYYDNIKRCGGLGDNRDYKKHMDELFRNCVVTPTEVAAQGMAYFDAKDDIKTPSALLREIETFLLE
jgi:uncharacterized glyoxalase superfamily metalloenzyme YdcJ